MTLFKSIAICSLCALPVMAPTGTLHCPGGQFTVNGSEDLATIDVTCDAAERAVEFLATCNISVEKPVTIDLVSTLPQGCVGMYHCTENRIEVLPPADMALQRPTGAALSHVSDTDLFFSVILHELTHAAFDMVACPYEGCLATTEYLAYTMQVMSLSAQNRAAFEAELDMQTPVSVEAINTTILHLAPDRFMQQAWIHLNQRDNPCGYIGDIMDGKIFMDHPNRHP